MSLKLITEADCTRNLVYAKNWGEVARVSRGISRSELARHLGLQVRHIKQIEDGNATPSPEIVEKMATMTGFPVEHFYRVPDCEDDWRDMPTSLDF